MNSEYYLFTTNGELVLSNKTVDLSDITSSDHAVADSRMMLHLRHAVIDGHKNIPLSSGSIACPLRHNIPN